MKTQRTLLIMNTPYFEMTEQEFTVVKKAAPDLSVTAVSGRKVTSELLENAEIIYGWPSKEQLKQARQLKWLHLPSAGADGFTNKENYCSPDIRLTNSSGVYGMPIAEHIFGMILSYNRDLQKYACNKLDRRWDRLMQPKDFFGSVMGIIGLGDIGLEVAKRAKALGASVLAVKRTLTEKPDCVDRLYTMEGLEEVLKAADYLVLALPNTSKTRGLINEERLRLMKQDALLINVGRGALIDQGALIRALSQGVIGGAALDVTEPEPLPKENPLWELPNVILTPHVSGLSPSNEKRRFHIFYQNLLRFLEAKPLQNQIDFAQEY